MRLLLTLLALSLLTACQGIARGLDYALECDISHCPKAYWASMAEGITNEEDITEHGINIVGKVEYYGGDDTILLDRIALFLGRTADREQDHDVVLVQKDGWFYAKISAGDHVFSGFAGMVNLTEIKYNETIDSSYQATYPLNQYRCQFGSGTMNWNPYLADYSDQIINLPPGKLLFLGVLKIQTKRFPYMLGYVHAANISQDLTAGDSAAVPNESFRRLLAQGEVQLVSLKAIPCVAHYVGHQRML